MKRDTVNVMAERIAASDGGRDSGFPGLSREPLDNQVGRIAVENPNQRCGALFMLRTLFAIVFFFPIVVSAQIRNESDVDKDFEAKAISVKANTDAFVRRLKDGLEELEKRLVQVKKSRIVRPSSSERSRPQSTNQGITFPSKEEKASAIEQTEAGIAQLKEQIEKYEKGGEFFYGPLQPTRLGNFGKFTGSVSVRQKVDANSMLVSYSPSSSANEQQQTIVILVKGISTKAAVEGGLMELPQVFEVTDTATFPTADGGTDTVFVIEPINVTRVEAVLRKAR